MFTIDSAVNKECPVLVNRGEGLGLYPYVFTSSKDEMLACRESAWLGCFLNCSPVYDITGPDAVKLLNYTCVNRDFGKLKIGGSRHALMCNEKGQLLADGLIIRTGDESFRTYWLAPILSFYTDTLGMNVSGAWVQDEYFYQIDGPKSLQIMEKASQTDLHDMKFAGRKNIEIAGTEVTIVRLGMSGALAYEIHGSTDHADVVYDAVVAAGSAFGLKRQGISNYCRSHTQGGYPNQWIHFWYPWLSSGQPLSDYIKACPYINPKFKEYPFLGSAGDDTENAFVTPFDVDWDYLINYDHDFIGKATLQKIAEAPAKKCVTLEWNAEDVGKVFATQFIGTKVRPADDITRVGDGGDAPYVISKVLINDKMIGMTSGRTHDYYHQKMISLAFIDKDYAIEGKELTVVWGTPGTTQVEIRATVAQFPYYNEEYRNETFDVEKIPHPIFE
ncbi:MAG: hypothetical protein PWP16_911 [Eubacteriaceae bacterium]|jgi:glycine cleavage system aminomethyltransferase T|nr:hypothetical protein [Eubacteriaceae bacterium]MDK2904686.1 hypothetical protein [Eubacteriaceae bacterium]MDN5307548.1 hypothetical protein [Eubacteriaceae bacterium]